MTLMAETEDDKPERAVPQLHAVTGDKEPPGYNWLSGLEPETCFICRPIVQRDPNGKKKTRPPFLEEYHVVYQGKHFTKLYTNLNQEAYFNVAPLEFCAIMELVEILPWSVKKVSNEDQTSGE